MVDIDPTSAMPMGDIDSSGVNMETTEADYTSDAEEEEEDAQENKKSSNENKNENEENEEKDGKYGNSRATDLNALEGEFDKEMDDGAQELGQRINSMSGMSKDSASSGDSIMSMEAASDGFSQGSAAEAGGMDPSSAAEMAAENPEVVAEGAAMLA